MVQLPGFLHSQSPPMQNLNGLFSCKYLHFITLENKPKNTNITKWKRMTAEEFQ